MRLKATGSILCLAALLFGVLPASAQDFRGRINGTVTDNTGAVLPGVTVTTTSPALIQPQVQVTGSDGSYRFQALPPGVYTVDFELTGFQTVKREGIRVVINQTLSVDQQLQVATLQETVTVTGESPVVDTTTTTMGTNFTKELLTEIPNARDVWAAMAQAPGMQMTAYDVGGSRTGNQTGYRTYGMDDQNQTRLEGIDTTEATNANAGYFDFGSFEEFQVGGAGADASAFAGGAVLSISVKSGSDRFSGSWYSDYQNEDMIANNVPDYLQVANEKNEDGYFTRTPLARGNQIQKQYDLNGNVGGPLWRGKAWGFFSYRLNDQYKYTTGLPSNIERSKLTNPWTFKVTYQMTQNNQLIGFINRRQKLQDKRGISVTTPLSAAYYQSSENTPMKAEWTSVLGSRMFLDVIVGNWWNFFPLRPVRDYGLYDGPWGPGRIDTPPARSTTAAPTTATRIRSAGSRRATSACRTSRTAGAAATTSRSASTSSATAAACSAISRSTSSTATPTASRRRSTSTTRRHRHQRREQPGGVAERHLEAHQPPHHDPRPALRALFRPVAGAGVRAQRHPGAGRLERRPHTRRSSPRARLKRAPVANTHDVSPRVGFAYDLSGDNRTVVKAYFGQSRWNSADELADKENPVGIAQLRYAFLPCTPTRLTLCDLNGNRLLDSPDELGAFNSTQGGAGFVRVDRDLNRPVTNEISTSLEREVVTGLSARASYVFKGMRDIWAEVDTIRTPQYTVPFTINDPGPGQHRRQRRRSAVPDLRHPGRPGQRPPLHQPRGQRRRLPDRGTGAEPPLLGQVDDAHLVRLHLVEDGAQPIERHPPVPTGYTRGYSYRPSDALFGDEFGRETSTIWNYKVIGRYVMPWDIGTSGSWRVQSGQNYGRTVSVPFPGDGTRVVRVEPITANRYDTISIFDLRLDKSFNAAGPDRAGHVPARRLQPAEQRRDHAVPADHRQLPRGHRNAGAAHLPRRLPLGLLTMSAWG